MHDHGRRSPASAHSPGVSGKLPGLHPDSGRSNRGFGTPSFSTTGLPGFNLDHLPFLFNSAPSLIFPPFLHPTPGSLFQPVLPPNFLPPPLPSQITSLFPSPNAECEAPSSGWSAHSGGSRNTSSLGSSSSDGDMATKLDGRTVRSSRCSPDMSLPPASLSSSVHKIWDGSVVDPVCISDADMPLSLVTRRETTSRGSSAAESGVCTGDSVARAASTETSRTPSLDGESSCHPVSENSGVQEQTVSTDQWPAGKVILETLPTTDDGKCSTGDDVWNSNTPASRSSGIALPPRKRLTRNAEELSSSTTDQAAASLTVAAGSPSSATNFRSCWKKFAAKSNVSGPLSHRAFGGKPQYDCRTYFQKLAEQARAAAASKAFVPGKGKGHCYRNANKANSRSSDQNTGSPRVTRSQSKPKKTQSPKSSPAEPPAPVRKSTRKKSINSRFEEYDRTVGKNKKSKGSSLDSSVAPADVGKETSQAAGDDVMSSADKNSQRKNRRRGKHLKGELSSTDADISSSICADAEDSTSQSQLTSDVSQPVSETDYKLSCTVSCSVPIISHEVTDLNAKTEPEPSTVITVLPPKFRHFKTKTFDSYQPQSNTDWPVTASSESNNSEGPVTVTADSAADSVAAVTQSDSILTEVEEYVAKPSLPTSVESSLPAETVVAEELKSSQSHSVGGRKSLLYRSSTAVDSQPAAEAKLTLTSSEAKRSEVIVSDTVSDEQLSADEKCGDPSVSPEHLSHNEVSLEQNEAVWDSIVPESASSECSEKVQDSSSDVHVEQQVETSLPDIVSCKSASLDLMDVDQKMSPSPTVSHTTTAYPNVAAGDRDSSTVSVDIVTESNEVPADSLDKCDSHSQLEPCEGSSDNSAMSGAESVHSQSTISITTASVVDEPRQCTTPVGADCETRDLTCRTKPAVVGGILVEDSVSCDSKSLKRSLPDEENVDEMTTKRLRTTSVDMLSTDALGQFVDTTPDTNSAVNLISSTSDLDSQICSVPNSKSCVVSEGKLQSAALSAGIQISLKSERTKSKSSKTNRRVKPGRRQRTANNVSIAQLPVLESSNNSDAETLPAESDLEKYDPPLLAKLLAGDSKKPASGTKAIVKYAVANSVDKMCDMNTDVSSAHVGNEQKTLRISLVAINESSHRVKDAKSESVCSSDKLSSSSVTVAVYTSASAVNNVEPLKSDVSLADNELPSVASTGCVVSQDSLTLEHDRSSLLSQCKTLSVVLEKMHNNKNATPVSDSPATTPTNRRRRGGLTHRRVGRLPKPKVPIDDLLLTANNTTSAEPSARSLADDEYRFPDDALSDNLPSQPMSRPDRKPSSRKARSLLPTAGSNQLAMSPAAASDSSSHGAVSSVDSSVASGNSAVRSQKPNAVQKVLSKSETRIRRRRHSLKEDDYTRSLSPFAENGGSPPPVLEASLDGHKLKLRIMKSANRSVEASTIDGKMPVMPPSSCDFTDSDSKLKDDKVLTPDRESVPVVEASSEVVSRRRRQLKVEGVRSRFLTLHKPSGIVPSADHVKCRLVKVGRRHWMSVGGDEPDDDSLIAQQSDTETPTKNSPTASAVVDMAQQPARDRLLLVSERKKQRTSTSRQSQPLKSKTNLTDANASLVSAKRTKKRVKTSASPVEVVSPKPEPVREIVLRPARDDPVPWLDYETEGSQPYCILGTSSSRTIATDINEYRLRVSTPAELSSNIDLVISDALSDCGVEFVYGSVPTPRSMYFVPSELERLMDALVLDDLRRQPRVNTPPTTVVAPGAHALSSASIARTFSYSSNVSSQYSSGFDVLLSQPSLRLQNCSLPVDASDSSECDCTVVGFEYPTHCYPDSVELPSLFDNQLVDDEYSLPLACPSEPHLYSYVDVFL